MKINEKSIQAPQAERFVAWALDCIHREFPNKISHLLASEADVATPRQLTPAFYGCYDWHSAVHNHWLLARLARLFPEAAFAGAAKQALGTSLAEKNIRGEVAYIEGEGRQSFERPYGLAWLLALAQELREWDEPLAASLATHLSPLEQAAKRRLHECCPSSSIPCARGNTARRRLRWG